MILSVFIAALVAFFLSYLWYGLVFGKTWMKLMNFTKKDIDKMKISPRSAMIIGFISYLVMAFVFSNLIDYLQILTINSVLILGLLIWIGFVCVIGAGSFLWEGKSVKLYLFNSIYSLIIIEVMAVILYYLG